MMLIIRIPLFVLTCCFSTAGNCTPANPLFEHYSYRLTDVVKKWHQYDYVPEREFNNDEGAISWHRLSGGYIRNPKQRTLTDLTSWGTHYSVTFLDFAKQGKIDNRLHAIHLPGIWMHKTPKFLYWMTLTPAFYSDMHSVGSEDFTVLGSILTSFQLQDNDDLRFVFGLQYDRAFGASKGYPTGGVIWTPTAKSEIRMTFPNPRFAYAPTANTAVFLTSSPTGSEWSVNSGNDFIRTRGFEHKIGGAYYLGDDAWIECELGYSTHSQIEYFTNNNWQIDQDVENRYMFNVRYIFR